MTVCVTFCLHEVSPPTLSSHPLPIPVSIYLVSASLLPDSRGHVSSSGAQAAEGRPPPLPCVGLDSEEGVESAVGMVTVRFLLIQKHRFQVFLLSF